MTAATDPPATRALPPRVAAACALMESDWSSWHMVLYGLTWADYEALLAARFEAGRKRMRITYDRGAAEVLVPGVDPREEAEPCGGGLRLIGLHHEVTRKRIAHLIEGWLCETGGHFVAAGHTTVSRPDRDLGFDADEVYFVRNWQRMVRRLEAVRRVPADRTPARPRRPLPRVRHEPGDSGLPVRRRAAVRDERTR